MKYWRGYLVAAILGFFTWGLRKFAESHSALVDMVYPYVTRMAQNFLVDWNSTVDFCVWQVLLLVILALIVASLVLMVVLKWNPIQWFGWVCAVAAVVVFLNTGLYGLNEFAGPLSDDIRLEETDFTVGELEKAAVYYRDQANKLADSVQRDGDGNVVYNDFAALADLAGDGFQNLTYEQAEPVFAGSVVPVKVLGWADWFTDRGLTGMTVGITGEAAVNPQTPEVLLPFAMCREMAKRMCIATQRDADFAAYLACMANSDDQFRYSGALMGYRFCMESLKALDKSTGGSSAAKIANEEGEALQADLAIVERFLAPNEELGMDVGDLMVSWHIQEVVIPSQTVEEQAFDPLDKTQVDLTGLPNVPTESTETTDEEDAG